LQHDFRVNQSKSVSIVYAINIINKALMPSIQNYLESYDQLAKNFRAILKASEFISSQPSSAPYQQLKAEELFGFFSSLA
jgi:hypothetical protein